MTSVVLVSLALQFTVLPVEAVQLFVGLQDRNRHWVDLR